MEHTEDNIIKETLESPVAQEATASLNAGISEKAAAATREDSEYFEFQAVDSTEHEQVDYSSFSKEEIVAHLQNLVTTGKIGEIREDVEELKSFFYKIHRLEVDAKRAAFLESGGVLEDFKVEDPAELKFKELYKKYKDQKNALNEQMEKEKQDNLRKRLALIDELKELANSNESVNKTFNDFREIQNKWKSIGMVPQTEMKNIWETYHHHVSKFYDLVKISRDLRDMDLKKNLDAKIEICEKAEQLMIESNIIKAFNELQRLHDQWREIGPVTLEKKNEVWERFKAATTNINKRHQDHYLLVKDQENKNLEAKELICQKIEEIVAIETLSLKEMNDKSAEIVEFQKLWKTIGFAPKKFNNEIYARFRKACDDFFNRKREAYHEIKGKEELNKQQKLDLCVQAEGLSTSTEWKKTSNELINLQKEWKAIGPVPKKDSEKIWKRFRSACDMFFNAKEQHFKNLDKEQEDNLQKKLSLLEKVQNLEIGENQDEALQMLQEIQKEWSEIGHIPFEKKDAIQAQFRDFLNKKFENLSIEDSSKKLYKYRVKMENVSHNKVDDKISFERTKHHKRVKELQDEIVLLENNIGFFSKSANADAIINEVKSKVEKHKKEIELIQKQVKMLDQIEEQEKK